MDTWIREWVTSGQDEWCIMVQRMIEQTCCSVLEKEALCSCLFFSYEKVLLKIYLKTQGKKANSYFFLFTLFSLSHPFMIIPECVTYLGVFIKEYMMLGLILFPRSLLTSSKVIYTRSFRGKISIPWETPYLEN